MKSFLFFCAVVIITIAPQTYTEIQRQKERDKLARDQQNFDQNLLSQSDTASRHIKNSIKKQHEQNGYIRVNGSTVAFTEKKLHQLLLKEGDKSLQFNYTWTWQGKAKATASSPGLDRAHHFVNSYLVGFIPFHTDQIWIPLYTLSMRKTYEYDHVQYTNMNDVWQNSRQAFYYTRGDCEDHALALADWLIGLGYDARVAVGQYKTIGHAWVILFRDGKEYLLEATSKQRHNSFSHYKLAALETDYKPRYQFNREQFWYNMGSTLTTRYSGNSWQLRSRFYATPQQLN